MGSKTTRFLDTTSMEKALQLARMRISKKTDHVRVVEFFVEKDDDDTPEESRFLVYPAAQTGKALKQLRDSETMFEVVADVILDPKKGIVISSPYDHAIKGEDYQEEETALFLAGLYTPDDIPNYHRTREAQEEGSLV